MTRQKLSRRERRHQSAIRRAKAKSRKTGGFTEEYYLDILEKKRKKELRKIAVKKKATYESRHQHNKSFYESFKENHSVSEIIKEMWNRGYKIRIDQYYKDFIDEHEDLLTSDFIDEIMRDKFEREEEDLRRAYEFWNEDNDPWASL